MIKFLRNHAGCALTGGLSLGMRRNNGIATHHYSVSKLRHLTHQFVTRKLLREDVWQLTRFVRCYQVIGSRPSPPAQTDNPDRYARIFKLEVQGVKIIRLELWT